MTNEAEDTYVYYGLGNTDEPSYGIYVPNMEGGGHVLLGVNDLSYWTIIDARKHHYFAAVIDLSFRPDGLAFGNVLSVHRAYEDAMLIADYLSDENHQRELLVVETELSGMFGAK